LNETAGGCYAVGAVPPAAMLHRRVARPRPVANGRSVVGRRLPLRPHRV